MVSNKERILRIIDTLYHECMSSCGDGDALWYTRFFSLEEIRQVIEEYNSKLRFPLEVNIVDEKNIHWGQGIEWIMITTDETVYNDAPSWAQFLLKN